MEWFKIDYLTFSEMRMRKRHLFCTSSHHNVPYEKQQEFTRFLTLKMRALARAREQLLNMLYIRTHLYIEIGTIYNSSWVDEWDLSHMV